MRQEVKLSERCTAYFFPESDCHVMVRDCVVLLRVAAVIENCAATN